MMTALDLSLRAGRGFVAGLGVLLRFDEGWFIKSLETFVARWTVGLVVRLNNGASIASGWTGTGDEVALLEVG